MRKKIIFMLPALMLVTGILFNSCKKDKAEVTGYSKGAYVVCEGGINKNDGTIFYLDPAKGTLIPNIFEDANYPLPVGDIVQSFTVVGSHGIIVANNSGLIRIVDLKTFKLQAEIPMEYPRYALAVNNNIAYVTSGKSALNVAGKVYIIDVSALKVIDSITVGYGPERLLKSSNKYIYVANNGGWNNDSTVSVIDAETNKVVKTIYVQADNPTNMVEDASGNIWALCKGKVLFDSTYSHIIYETNSKMVQIDEKTNEVKNTFVIGSLGDYFYPKDMAISNDKKTIYIVELQGVYIFDPVTGSIGISAFIPGYLLFYTVTAGRRRPAELRNL